MNVFDGSQPIKIQMHDVHLMMKDCSWKIVLVYMIIPLLWTFNGK